ncbi:DUF6232 family protein [Streptomyces sp. NPDC059697]|uniref:DUF6232 family protein n=1 Tax=Streptomyces sp. NPDC059697 TaxID=3346912 RepID=UPI0036A0A296
MAAELWSAASAGYVEQHRAEGREVQGDEERQVAESNEVRLEDGVLKVRDGRYPLRSISYVGQRMLKIDRKKATKWEVWAIAWLIFLIFAIAASMDDPPSSYVAKWLLFLIPEALFIWRIYSILHAPPVYALALDTSGVTHDVAWSWDSAEIEYIVNEITRALSYPEPGSAHYHHIIRNTVEGDVINQYGDGNLAKAQHFGRGDIGTK